MTQQTARDLLLERLRVGDARDWPTSAESDVEEVIREALASQPSLRTCLYPGCIRQYDAMAAMSGRKPANPSWSGEGWKTVPRGPAPGALCPAHVDIVTAHLPRTVDLPNGRWMVSCACDWMSRPQTYGGLLRPLWEEHLLTAAGTLTVPVTLAEVHGRLPLEEHTEDTLRDLYDALEDTECDRAETREAAQAMYKSWDWHRHALAGVSRAVVTVCNMIRTSADFMDHRDWTANRTDAFLWAILVGFDDTTLADVAARHDWNDHRMKYVREMHALLAPTRDPSSPVPTDTDPRQNAYDAVLAYIHQQPVDFMPTTIVDRNALIWDVVHTALGAVGVLQPGSQLKGD